MGEFFRRIRYLLARRRHDRELQQEMEFHREMVERDGRSSFGHTLLLREESREAWGWMWLDRLQQDLLYGARVLRRSPSFTLAAVAILALGIGVNLAAFHVFNVLVLKPLPVRDPDSIVRLTRADRGFFSSDVSYPAMEFYRQNNTVLSAVLGVTQGELTFGREGAERVRAQFVTANYFTDLGATAAYGRVLHPGTDDIAAAQPVAVLSYGFWQRRFGSDPAVAGQTIHLNLKPVIVAGVAPYDFTGVEPANVDVWLPVTGYIHFFEGSNLLTDFSRDTMHMFGRMKPGVTLKQTEDALKPVVAALHEQQPEHIRENEKLAAQPGAYIARVDFSDLSGGGRGPLLTVILFALLVLLILAIACANLGNLLLARAVTREREIAIRTAVGAGRARITRQLLTESLLLALLGTAAGMAVSVVAVRLLIAVLEVPWYMSFALDYRVFLFALAITVLATVFFGLAPSLAATRQGYRAHRMRRVLIAAQVAASCLLLIVSALMVRSLRVSLATHMGFEYERVASLDPGLSSHGYQPAAAAAYWGNLRARLSTVAGVESVALATIPPLGNRVVIQEGPGGSYRAYGNEVDPHYFRTMTIPLLSGRNFVSGDKDVAIVGATLAQRLWPGQDPLGQTFPESPRVVIGVAGRARTVAGDAEATEVYLPLQADSLPSAVLLVKTAEVPDALVETLRAAARADDARLMPEVTLLRDSYQRRMQASGRGAMVVSAMGLLAALLAATGVYGLVCFAVSQRQKEIGIRMALGAMRGDILGLILRQFYGPVGAGVVVGVAAAAGISVVLRSFLFGISHLDPLSYTAAVLFFVLLAGVAVVVPARRALRVNPADVLRYE